MTDKELFSVVGILPEKTPAAPAVRRRRLPVLPMAVLAVIVLALFSPACWPAGFPGRLWSR